MSVSPFFHYFRFSVHESDVMDVIGEVGAWFKFGGHGTGPLTTAQFIEVVTKSMESEIGEETSQR